MSGRRAGMAAVRIGLPVALSLVGVVAIVAGHARTPLAGAGVVLLGIGLMVWMLNWLFRMSVESNRDREREEEAREHYSRTGRWPDEERR
jgi:hypothetical protein